MPPSAATDSLITRLHRLGNRADTRLASGFLLIFLLCYGLTATLLGHLYQQHNQSFLQEYGNTVARQLALSTEDAVVRSDLVSLRAHLEALTRTPSLPEAAVYDMENNVLAQSIRHSNDEANTPDLPKDIHHFSALITFQDSIAGKVIIGLDAHAFTRHRHWLTGYLLCGFILASLFTVLLSRYFILKGENLYRQLLENIHNIRPHVTDGLKSKTQLPSLDQTTRQLGHLQEYIQKLEQGAPVLHIASKADSRVHTAPGNYAELLLYCSNMDNLQQQLHYREMNRLLDELDHTIQQVTELYAAVEVPHPGEQVLLRFYQDDVTDAALQAICCAVILCNLTKAPEQAMAFLDLRFAIHWHQLDQRKISGLLRNHLAQQEYHELSNMCQQARAGEILVSKGIKRSGGVAEHTKMELISGSADVEVYRLQKLSDNYRNLLEQQIKKLLADRQAPLQQGDNHGTATVAQSAED